MARTINYRGYINAQRKAVMIWSKSLKCWNVNYYTDSNVIHGKRKTLSAFANCKSEAITYLRNESDYGDPRLPQSGWEKYTAKIKSNTSSWNALAQEFLNQTQNKKA